MVFLKMSRRKELLLQMTGIKEVKLANQRDKDDLDRSITSLDPSLDWAKEGGPDRHSERKLLVQKEFRCFFAMMTDQDK